MLTSGALGLSTQACGEGATDDDGGSSLATGGIGAATGGASWGTGGSFATGGAFIGTGGSNATGGATTGTGGAVVGTGGEIVGTGGAIVGTGGAVTGGASSGGAATGGASTGGSGTGGSGTGGSSGCTGPVPGTKATNPLIGSIFTADPAVLVHDCTFYITAGHDEGTTGFNLKDWYVLSSTDLVNWSYNGGPKMTLQTFSWANANAWAGQMIERDGKFYWYVPVNEKGGGMAIGVAVGNSPLGPFTDAKGSPLVNDAWEMAAFNYSQASQTAYTIDPTVFVDDDGQAYLLYGGFWRLVIVRLGDDMISLEGTPIERTPQGFFEAPYLTKRNGVYYMIYAAGSNPATIDYATASGPTGPWQYRGRILDALPAKPGQDAPTSHPAVAEFQGQWYLVYHISNGANGGTYKRQVAMEKLTFNADGTIPKITPTSGIQF